MADTVELDLDEALDKAFKETEEKEAKDGKEAIPEKETKKGESEETEAGEEEETETAEKPTETEESATEKSDEPDEELSEEIQDALTLWRGLEGPEAVKLLQSLAAKANLRLVTAEQKKELTPAEKAKVLTTQEIAREALGEDYEFLADKLANILDKVIEERVEKPMRTAQERAEINNITAEVSKFFAATPGITEKQSQEIAALIEEMPQKPGTDTQVYLGRLYKLVTADSAKGDRTSKVLKKIEENSKRANPRTSEVSETSLKKGPKLPELDEAIDAAFQKIAFEHD